MTTEHIAKVIEAAVAYTEDLFSDNSGGHDTGHTMRVYRNAMQIAEREKGCDRMIVALAALLHDADDHKLFDTKDNENARKFLQSQDISKEQTDRICDVINSVSFSKNRGKVPDTIEGMIVQDADRLDAMGAIGIARTFAYGGEHGRPLEQSVQHFYDKLLLLKDEMNTGTAKKIAEQRHMFLENYLDELRKETECELLKQVPRS